MDATDTAADVIRERDQLKERVRELEMQLEFVLRVREDLLQRKNKAREILKSYTPMPGKASGFLSEIIRQALEALEGK